MIVYPNRGKGKGKVGNSVFYVNHGVQIEREYTAQVSNPNTTAQVSQRSRFKLASQISAIFEPVIAIPRKGLQSPRNQFTKLNMGYFYGSEDEAQVSPENLQLTLGSVYLPAVSINRGQITEINMALAAAADETISRVIYSMFKLGDNGLMQFVDSLVVNSPGTNRTFPITKTFSSSVQYELFYVYAYGMRDRDDKAKAKYYNYEVSLGTELARLIAQRSIDPNAYALTQTRCSIIYAGQTSNVTPAANKVFVYITIVGKGSVTVKDGVNEVDMAGTNRAEVGLGHDITLTATPETTQGEIWRFDGWYNNGEQVKFSSANPYQFQIAEQRDIVAKFVPSGLE